MTVPQVYYNREDLWVLPQENYAGTVAPMKPYYILMKLPGSDTAGVPHDDSFHASEAKQHDLLAGRQK